MDDKQEPLLSICIPTYNRCKKLSYCLQSIYESIIFSHAEKEVEVIISDNCSVDSTFIVAKQFLDINKCFKYYKNDQNLGFNKNMFLLTDNYAKGIYCWLIGDDDLIVPNALSILIPLLREKKAQYISLGYKFISENDINHLPSIKVSTVDSKLYPFSLSIDKNAVSGNIMATFMSVSIFNLDIFKLYDKSAFGSESWVSCKDTFPNGYLLNKLFAKEKNTYSITCPIICIVPDKKDWDDKLKLANTRYLPELFNLSLKFGCQKKNLKNNKKIIFLNNIYVFLSDIKNKKLNFKALSNCFLFFDFTYFFSHINRQKKES